MFALGEIFSSECLIPEDCDFQVPLHRHNAATIYHDLPMKDETYTVYDIIDNIVFFKPCVVDSPKEERPTYYNYFECTKVNVRFCMINGNLCHIGDDIVYDINTKEPTVYKLEQKVFNI